MNDLLSDVAERARRYLDGLDQRGVAPSADALQQLNRLNGPLPEGETDPEAVIDLLDSVCSPAAMGNAGGRYFGFVVGGALPVALGANWMAGAWDQNAFSGVSSPMAAAVEQIALRWLLDVLGLPSMCGGAFVTGATMANFTGLAAARQAVLENVGWNVVRQGLFGAPPITVIVGEEVHPTLLKALGMLGLGRERVVTVPVDDEGCMRADALPTLSGPTIICLQAGNVNSGAFDPADAICPRAREAGAWVHVDGAFGLWAAAAPERAHLVAGFSQADSWATDAHKWLNVPYDSGLAILRTPEPLRKTMVMQAAYLPPGDTRDPHDYTPEASRRARGVEVWAVLRSLGRSGLADLVERTCRYATRFAEGLGEAGYTILNDVHLNQVLVSFGDAATTRRVIAALQDDGTCWCGETVWKGHTAMRISVSSWATTEDDVERSLTAMIRLAQEHG